jgi:hypothetical protein
MVIFFLCGPNKMTHLLRAIIVLSVGNKLITLKLSMLSHFIFQVINILFCCFVLFCFVLFCRQGFSLKSWLSWNSFCRSGQPQTQKSTCLCLLSAGIKGLCHHRPAYSFFFLTFLFLFFFKDLYIVICKYTVAVFRQPRRGHQISLWIVVSHHVVAGIWTLDLRKSSQCF